MKESKLIEMDRKIGALTRVVQQLITETKHMRELSVGTLATLKLMPKYNESIKKLKDQYVSKLYEENIADKFIYSEVEGGIKLDGGKLRLDLSESAITGTLPVSRGGTGTTSALPKYDGIKPLYMTQTIAAGQRWALSLNTG